MTKTVVIGEVTDFRYAAGNTFVVVDDKFTKCVFVAPAPAGVDEWLDVGDIVEIAGILETPAAPHKDNAFRRTTVFRVLA